MVFVVIVGLFIKLGGLVIFLVLLGGSLLLGVGGFFGVVGFLDLDFDFKYFLIVSSFGGLVVFLVLFVVVSLFFGVGGLVIFLVLFVVVGLFYGVGDLLVVIGGVGMCFFCCFLGIFWYCFFLYNYRYIVFNLIFFYIYFDMYI